MDKVVTELYHQVRLMSRISQPILTANGKLLKTDNWFMSGQLQPGDRGAALYFRVGKSDRVLACDRWNRLEDNIWAIARHIDVLRAQERYHVGNIEQAFAGYTALPAPGQSEANAWWRVLGVAHDAPFEVAREVYVSKAKLHHPDVGGDAAAMAALNAAWDQARSAYGRA